MRGYQIFGISRQHTTKRTPMKNRLLLLFGFALAMSNAVAELQAESFSPTVSKDTYPAPYRSSSKAGIRANPDLRYYPLANYRRFPASIRLLLQMADLEHDHCRNHGGHDADGFRACDRQDRIERRLEQRGWCWGSVNPLAPEAEKSWLRCSRLPHYRRAH